jgi:hypothetical protein
MEWSYKDMQNFKNLLCPNDTDPEPVREMGSVLNPTTATGGKQIQLANPNVKIEAKVYSKQTINPEINKKAEEAKVAKEKEAKRANDTKIWDDAPIQDKAKAEGRPEPKYEVLPLQHVGTEDVFLGLSGKDPSSVHCDGISVKINLPGTATKEINVDLGVQSMVLQV